MISSRKRPAGDKVSSMADQELSPATPQPPDLAALLLAVSFAYQKDWMSLKESDDFSTHSHGAAR
jgi:hypothetical protein